MLTLQQLRTETESVITGLTKKYVANAGEIIAQIIAFDDDRKAIQQSLNDLQSQVNASSGQIGQLMKEGKKEEAEAQKGQVASLKGQIGSLEDQLKLVEEKLEEALVQLPNRPHSSVPSGRTPEENEVTFTHGDVPSLGPEALPHWELLKKFQLADFELGNKLTGAGFPVYTGKGAKYQRALIQFFLDQAEKQGYKEIQPPILVNKESAYATGQLPDKEGQMYYVTEDELYLIPTAEVPITNIHRDDIIDEKALPVKYVGYTPCFRREAGSWGAHVRGLNRLHQFDKVEIVQYALPEKSYEHLDQMSAYVQSLLQALELPYRVLLLCGGDMSFASAKTFDMEVFSAAQQRWLEVSSVSNFESFQANRLKLRYRNAEKKNQLLHTLNGSALALPRILAALLENNQQSDKITIPKALQPYTGFAEILLPA